METIESVLEFWFGSPGSTQQINDRQSKLWWSKNDTVDREIKSRFSSLTESIFSQGSRHDWRRSADGCLASIICLDQFPRNMYRGAPRSFSYDEAALSLAKSVIASSLDLELTPIQRLFVYLPFEHSEEIEDQNASLRLFRGLVDAVDRGERELFEGFYEFAERHHRIIAQFGRFPHRNQILERESSVAEKQFLELPGSSF